jgi:hypothetical protein
MIATFQELNVGLLNDNRIMSTTTTKLIVLLYATMTSIQLVLLNRWESDHIIVSTIDEQDAANSIAGFTARSSVREPSQVFTLLENLFQQYDMIAKRRRVGQVIFALEMSEELNLVN